MVVRRKDSKKRNTRRNRYSKKRNTKRNRYSKKRNTRRNRYSKKRNTRRNMRGGMQLPTPASPTSLDGKPGEDYTLDDNNYFRRGGVEGGDWVFKAAANGVNTEMIVPPHQITSLYGGLTPPATKDLFETIYLTCSGAEGQEQFTKNLQSICDLVSRVAQDDDEDWGAEYGEDL